MACHHKRGIMDSFVIVFSVHYPSHFQIITCTCIHLRRIEFNRRQSVIHCSNSPFNISANGGRGRAVRNLYICTPFGLQSKDELLPPSKFKCLQNFISDARTTTSTDRLDFKDLAVSLFYRQVSEVHLNICWMIY